MIDWNYIASVIATVAFDIIYFGAIIGTIVIVILDNRNGMDSDPYVPSGCRVGFLFLFRA